MGNVVERGGTAPQAGDAAAGALRTALGQVAATAGEHERTPALPAREFLLPWGTVAFQHGLLSGVRLTHGSGANLLDAELPALLLAQEGSGALRPLPLPGEWHAEEPDGPGQGGRVTAWGYAAAGGLGYTLTWTVYPWGYLRLEVHADAAAQPAPLNDLPVGTLDEGRLRPPLPAEERLGPVTVALPFSSRRLDTAYCASTFPPGVWALGALDDAGFAYGSTELALAQTVTLYRHATEAVSVVPHQGWLRRLDVLGGEQAVVAYALDGAGRRLYTSLYLLFAPVRRRRSLKRAVFAMYNPQTLGGPPPFVEFPRHRQTYFPGTSPEAIRAWAARGYRYLVFHDNWQTWEPGSNARYGEHRPEDEGRLRSLMDTARQAGMQVICYFGLLNEQETTDFSRQSGDRYATYHAARGKRRIMCLETPYLEHQKGDLDYILDELGADGVFFDWMRPVPCYREHGSHSLPTTSIRGMLELLAYVQARGKECFIHPTEEWLVPFIFDVADLSIVGERSPRIGWESLRPVRERLHERAAAAPEASVAYPHGIVPLERWTANAGHVAFISFAEKDDTAEMVAAALAEGFNPLGYSEAGEAQVQLAKALAAFPVEQMTYDCWAEELGVTCDPQARVAALQDSQHLVLLVVGLDAATVRLRVPASALPLPAAETAGGAAGARYRVRDHSGSLLLRHLSAAALAEPGVSLAVVRNAVHVLAITVEAAAPSSTG